MLNASHLFLSQARKQQKCSPEARQTLRDIRLYLTLPMELSMEVLRP
jgi:hypothetical protein